MTCFALACDYGLSLPFYLFYPTPERWAYTGSDAVLLSDIWSSRLVEAFRPVSAIDNCFPSLHVSATVVAFMVAFLFHARYRSLSVPVGLAVIAATFVLGIHWLADIVAGVSAGILSVWFGVRCDARIPVPRCQAPGLESTVAAR